MATMSHWLPFKIVQILLGVHTPPLEKRGTYNYNIYIYIYSVHILYISQAIPCLVFLLLKCS